MQSVVKNLWLITDAYLSLYNKIEIMYVQSLLVTFFGFA